jgi:hypothetical protein
MNDTLFTILEIALGNGLVLGIVGLVFRFGGMYEKIDRAIADIAILKHNVKAVANSMAKSKHVEFDHSLLRDYSLLQLTEKGKGYIKDKGFDAIFESHKRKFFNVMDSDCPTSKYDVEASASKAILALLHKSFFNPIKKYYYEHRKEDINGFIKVASIYLRDRYLEEHPEIKE